MNPSKLFAPKLEMKKEETKAELVHFADIAHDLGWTSSTKHVEATTSPRGQGRSEGQEGVAAAKDQGLQDTWRKLRHSRRSYIFQAILSKGAQFMLDE